MLAHDTEPALRYEWWLNHGCSYTALYGDDGEMQCNACFVDFKRASLDALHKHVVSKRLALGGLAWQALQAEAPGTIDYLVIASFVLRAQSAEDAVNKARVRGLHNGDSLSAIKRGESGGFIPLPERRVEPTCPSCGNTRADGQGIVITGGDAFSGPLGDPCDDIFHDR